MTRDVSFVIKSAALNQVTLYNLDRHFLVPVPTVSSRQNDLQDMEKQVELWYDMTYSYVTFINI